jgi:glutamate-1-semialdehyde 2,1-aminomutase
MSTPVAQDRIASSFERERPQSSEAYQRARQLFPSGVAHDGRLIRPFPITLARAQGAYKWDIDGNKYIDFHLGSSALLLGHAHPEVVAAIQEQVTRGWHYAQPHPLEAEWGELIKKLMPSVQRLRFVNTGTEANMLNLRVARAFTGKPKILRFEGGYHGWLPEGLLGQRPPFQPLRSPGIPQGVADTVVGIPINDADLVARTLDADPDIGAVIVEPSGPSYSMVPLEPGFLQAVRDITTQRQRLLIFDEVITGFRWSPGGAQERFGVRPDLTSMAKIVSGGLPGGAVGGRADVMSVIEPSGDKQRDALHRVYHAGTYNGNPLTAAAAVVTLKHAATGEPQRHAEALANQLKAGVNERIKRMGISAVMYGESSAFHVYLGPRPQGTPVGESLWTRDAAVLRGMPTELVEGLRLALQMRGVDLMSGTGGVLSAAHTPDDIEEAIVAFAGALESVAAEFPHLVPQ